MHPTLALAALSGGIALAVVGAVALVSSYVLTRTADPDRTPVDYSGRAVLGVGALCAAFLVGVLPYVVTSVPAVLSGTP